MAKQFIITLTAANRVGILAALTTALDELGGDLREVSQTVVQKFFTMIVAADFPETRDRQVILDHIHDICRPYGVEVGLRDPTQETLQPENGREFERYFLTIEGDDKPGILRQITTRLAAAEIDITDLFANHREESGSFIVAMELAVPTNVDIPQLNADLSDLSKSLEVTCNLRHESDFESANDPRPVRSATSVQSIPR